VIIARVAQVSGRGSRLSELLPDPGGASTRAFLITGIVVVSAVSLARLTILYPSLKPVEPLSGTSLLSPTTGNPTADRAAAIPAPWRSSSTIPWASAPRTSGTLSSRSRGRKSHIRPFR